MHTTTLLLLATLGGCMTDGNGNSCAWTPGSDGQCPSDSSGGGGPTIHSYYSGTAAAVGDVLRVVMTSSEGGTKLLESTTVLANSDFLAR